MIVLHNVWKIYIDKINIIIARWNMKIIEKVFNDDTIKFLQKTDDGLILETAFIEEKSYQ